MPTIPNDEQFIGTSGFRVLKEKRSALVNSGSAVYTYGDRPSSQARHPLPCAGQEPMSTTHHRRTE